MEHHVGRYHALAAELKSRGWLGWDEQCPLAEVLLTTSDMEQQGLDLVPHAGHEQSELEKIQDFCARWDWGGRKPPPVRLATPWREPDCA